MAKKDKEVKKLTSLMVALIIFVTSTMALIIIMGGIQLNELKKLGEENKEKVFQEGVQSGVEQTMNLLAKNSIECEPFPIYVGEQEINLIALECLQ